MNQIQNNSDTIIKNVENRSISALTESLNANIKTFDARGLYINFIYGPLLAF